MYQSLEVLPIQVSEQNLGRGEALARLYNSCGGIFIKSIPVEGAEHHLSLVVVENSFICLAFFSRPPPSAFTPFLVTSDTEHRRHNYVLPSLLKHSNYPNEISFRDLDAPSSDMCFAFYIK